MPGRAALRRCRAGCGNSLFAHSRREGGARGDSSRPPWLLLLSRPLVRKTRSLSRFEEILPSRASIACPTSSRPQLAQAAAMSCATEQRTTSDVSRLPQSPRANLNARTEPSVTGVRGQSLHATPRQAALSNKQQSARVVGRDGSSCVVLPRTQQQHSSPPHHSSTATSPPPQQPQLPQQQQQQRSSSSAAAARGTGPVSQLLSSEGRRRRGSGAAAAAAAAAAQQQHPRTARKAMRCAARRPPSS
jgi:hypothetical protein